MNKLKQDPFLAAMAGAGVLIVLFFAYIVFFSWSGNSEIYENLGYSVKDPASLKDPATQAPVAGQPDIDAYRARKEEYGKIYADIVDNYRKADASFESFFTPGLRPSQFLDPYRNRIQQLEEALGRDGIALRPPADPADPEATAALPSAFRWEIPTAEQWARNPRQEEHARLLQKRFWIRQRIADAARSVGKQGLSRLIDVTFFDPDAGLGLDNAPAREGEIKLEDYPAAPAQGQKEYALPDNIGRTITFGCTAEVMYGAIPRFLRDLLRAPTPGSPQILVNLVGLRVYTLQQNDFEADIKFDPNKNDGDQKKQEAEKALRPQPVTIQVTCTVIDYKDQEKK